MSGRLDFEYGFNSHSAKRIDAQEPMRVYFLGNFSAVKAEQENAPDHKILRIDIDNFDQVMTKLSPSICLPSGHQLTFNELEDFHPNNLINTPVFKNLRRLKRELSNPNTAEQAANEVMTQFQLDAQKSAQEADIEVLQDAPETDNNDDMFERLLGKKQSVPSEPTSAASGTQSIGNLDLFLAQLLKPHIVNDTKPEHLNLLAIIDQALQELMKSILHSKQFQAIESLWRGVRDVIFSEEYDEEEQFFYLIDADHSTLDKAVAGDTVLVSKISQHLKDTDVTTYDVLVADYQFSASHEDITALNYLASLGEALKCQVVSGADDSLVNSPDESLWHEFRQTPQASYLALSYPRVLLRLPYGEKYDEVDSFAFEEFPNEHQHNQLLWGNLAFACARLLIRQYQGLVSYDAHITELPAFVYAQGDEQKLHACGEYLLSEQQLMDIQKQGISPFASFRNRNCIRLYGDKIKAVSNLK
ncbi:type VI secretion system contractile sheath large subunit [uncultured Paraglaciecola sp.]|uniref:type VI secretion system contractile sheath domain-containing protein n=1 Tax=uncultured Paraglaciecola sp. TaxID=1765024 RepID=UPI0030D9234A|tara:strand:- start:434570 stop:435988 length:1419 start_codon:yes stop_codon:yes gene_type:complete